MKSKKKKLLKITALSLVIAIALWVNGGLKIHLDDTAYAVGDLIVDWGVPEGDPIFEISNFAPGDMEVRTVDITNDGISANLVAVRGVKTNETDSLSEVLDIVISEGGTDLYGGTSATGPKTLEEFFVESGGSVGTPLSSLDPTESTTYSFKVAFNEDAGNDFQETGVVFDLLIGKTVEVPEECQGIEFDGDPITGTTTGDLLNGTSGNDLIFGLGGGDVINGRGGDDCLVGGDASDLLKGGNGNDVLLGGAGGDALQGGNGQDSLFGEGESDSLKGGNGNDYLEGGEGSDGLKGNNGNDEMYGNEGSDGLKGGPGDDFLDGGSGSDGLKGNAGIDTCINGETVASCELP